MVLPNTPPPTLPKVEVKIEPGDVLWKGWWVCVWIWVFVSSSLW